MLARDAWTHAGNQPFQHADPRQEHFAINEMCHGQIKEDREALFTPLGTGIEPAQKANVFWLGSKIVIAILLHDFVGMIVAHFTLSIAGEDCRNGNVELGSERHPDAVSDVGRIGQERAQEANSTKLEGEPQARMVVTARF